MFMSKSNPIA